MSRVFTASVILAVLFLKVSAAAAQPSVSSEVACHRAAFSPTLDGRLDDWPRLPQVVTGGPEDWHPADARFAEYGGPDDISAEVRLAWNNQALYLALETRDDNLVHVRSAAEIDRGDSIVLALAVEGADEINQFVVALLKAASLVWRAEPAAGAGEVRTIGRALWARPEEGGSRVTYELAIPWSELKHIRPIPGTKFALTVSVCDDDEQGLKGCLERLISVTLSAAAIAHIDATVEPRLAPSPAPVFPAPNAVRFDNRCFTLDGRDALILGGEIDYAHLPREAWPGRLERLRAAGLNTVGATVPWSHHQPRPDAVDLGDLRSFLDLCKASGLWVQLNIGPYANENWEAGGVPGWVVAAASPEDQAQAIETWYKAVLPLVAEYQVTVGGPVAYVVVRPLPDNAGNVDAVALQKMLAAVRSAEIALPVLTANAPAARDNMTWRLANVLDTLSFYTPVDHADIVPRLKALAREENGPVVVAALPGDYRSAPAARRSLDVARIALANGATVIVLSEFAPGLDASLLRKPGEWTGGGIVDAAGARTGGYGEARLLAGFVRQFGSELARAVPADGLVEADDPNVGVAARFGIKQGFAFIWNKEVEAGHQVRLTYLEPGTEIKVNIPEAGVINLPPGAAKVVPLDVPVGRGVVRYSTSELAAVHPVGERTLVVVYGDVDTPGEIALRLPGPPLVTGQVTRQRWDAETKTLIIDYYHGADDRHILVDEIEICVLSRARAARVSTIAGKESAITLSADAQGVGGSLDADGLEAVLDCPEGITEVTAILPGKPSSVTVDGEPVDFTFTTPARLLTFRISTESFESGQGASSFWDRLGRAITGGPPKLYARFDRGLFMPDARALGGYWEPVDALGESPEVLGLSAGSFARLRTRFLFSGSAEMTISGSADPMLVLVNGQFVPGLSGSGPLRRAEVSSLLRTGENEVEVIAHLLPRGRGLTGLRDDQLRLPEIRLIGQEGEVIPEKWEIGRGLGGEAAGWPGADVDTRRWHFIGFGPWREQGRDLADMWGVGWYRVPFGLPQPGTWDIPYYLSVTLYGAGNLYLNGRRLATCRGDGDYVLPLPTPPLRQGNGSVLTAALYGLGPQTGLHRVEIAADERRMTRRRLLEIRF